MNFRKKVRDTPVVGQVAYILSTAGKKQLFNPAVLFKTIAYMPRFLGDLWRFKNMAKANGTQLTFKNIYPVYVDYAHPVVNKHYWFQDIYVASKIITASRECEDLRHVDIGSRLEGFITSLISAGIDLTFGDINVPKMPFPNATARFIDLQAMTPEQFKDVRSVSCLHVIEHLGLGKYGDAIDPIGHRRIFADFGAVLESGTKLYISSPTSRRPGIVFNGGRHLDPREMIEDACAAGFTVDEIGFVQDNWDFIIDPTPEQMASSDYGCVILCLTRQEDLS